MAWSYGDKRYKTMTQKVLWKNRDIIIIDMPPGTGDTQLTLLKK